MGAKEEIKRISFSEFKNWKECPYRHKLIYIDKEPYYSENIYTVFGTSMHFYCEEVMRHSNTVEYKVFKNKFLKEIGRLTESGVEIDLSLKEQMLNQAKHMCNQILPAVKDYFGNFDLVSIEEPLLEEMDDIESYGRKFKGFIDLTIKTSDGKYHIIDWKTCSWGWPSQKKTSPLTNYQLMYYKNYFSKKHRVEPKSIETYFALLKRTPKNKNVEILRVTSGNKKIQNSLKVLQNAVINIERQNYVKNKLSCKYCTFKNTEKCP